MSTEMMSLAVICPRCLSESAVQLNLQDGDTFTCPSCDEEYTLDSVREMVAGWSHLLPWLLANPVRQPATE